MNLPLQDVIRSIRKTLRVEASISLILSIMQLIITLIWVDKNLLAMSIVFSSIIIFFTILCLLATRVKKVNRARCMLSAPVVFILVIGILYPIIGFMFILLNGFYQVLVYIGICSWWFTVGIFALQLKNNLQSTTTMRRAKILKIIIICFSILEIAISIATLLLSIKFLSSGSKICGIVSSCLNIFIAGLCLLGSVKKSGCLLNVGAVLHFVISVLQFIAVILILAIPVKSYIQNLLLGSGYILIFSIILNLTAVNSRKLRELLAQDEQRKRRKALGQEPPLSGDRIILPAYLADIYT